MDVRMASENGLIAGFHEEIDFSIRIKVMQFLQDGCRQNDIAQGSGLYDQEFFQSKIFTKLRFCLSLAILLQTQKTFQSTDLSNLTLRLNQT